MQKSILMRRRTHKERVLEKWVQQWVQEKVGPRSSGQVVPYLLPSV